MKKKKQMWRRDVPRVSLLPSLYGEGLQGHHTIRVQTVTPNHTRRRDLMLYLHDATSSGSYDWVTGFVIPRPRCVTAGTLGCCREKTTRASRCGELKHSKASGEYSRGLPFGHLLSIFPVPNSNLIKLASWMWHGYWELGDAVNRSPGCWGDKGGNFTWRVCMDKSYSVY